MSALLLLYYYYYYYYHYPSIHLSIFYSCFFPIFGSQGCAGAQLSRGENRGPPAYHSISIMIRIIGILSIILALPEVLRAGDLRFGRRPLNSVPPGCVWVSTCARRCARRCGVKGWLVWTDGGICRLVLFLANLKRNQEADFFLPGLIRQVTRLHVFVCDRFGQQLWQTFFFLDGFWANWTRNPAAKPNWDRRLLEIHATNKDFQEEHVKERRSQPDGVCASPRWLAYLIKR